MNTLSPTDALIGIGMNAPMFRKLISRPTYDGESPMRVVAVQRDRVVLHDGAREVPARLPPALVQALEGDGLAVGDWVLAAEPSPGLWRVVERVPPISQIARRTNDGRGSPKRQVLVSNVDTALLVMGLDHDFNLRRLERYLALARLAHVAAVVVLTKADTVDSNHLRVRRDQARDTLGDATPLLALDARDAAAALDLARWLTRGQTLVLLGSSGAGKSTLTNALCGSDLQDTGSTRSDDSRGRHTTTARTMRFAATGACVIDTPGLRALRLDVDEASDLSAAFGDVAALAARCRFRDCRHRGEPGCAVLDALPPERVRNYHKLLREVRRDSMNAREQREQRAQWKARGREAAIRSRAKRT